MSTKDKDAKLRDRDRKRQKASQLQTDQYTERTIDTETSRVYKDILEKSSNKAGANLLQSVGPGDFSPVQIPEKEPSENKKEAQEDKGDQQNENEQDKDHEKDDDEKKDEGDLEDLIGEKDLDPSLYLIRGSG